MTILFAVAFVLFWGSLSLMIYLPQKRPGVSEKIMVVAIRQYKHGNMSLLEPLFSAMMYLGDGIRVFDAFS